MFIYNFFFKKKEVKPLIIGLEGSGKSCFLHRIMLNEYVEKVPEQIGGTGHFIFENHQAKFDVVDLKGDEKSIKLWMNFIDSSIDIVLFTVDTKDKEKFEKVKKVLHETLSKIDVDVPILILGTKIDLNGAKEDELIEKLKLKELKQKTVDVMLISSKTTESISDSIDWMVSF
eukprot:gene6799-10965_t